MNHLRNAADWSPTAFRSLDSEVRNELATAVREEQQASEVGSSWRREALYEPQSIQLKLNRRRPGLESRLRSPVRDAEMQRFFLSQGSGSSVKRASNEPLALSHVGFRGTESDQGQPINRALYES